MNYIRKICPTCGREFVILKEVEEKAVYCTIECLLEFQDEEGNEFILYNRNF